MLEITRSALVAFGYEVRWYGILIALGVLLAVVLAAHRERRLGLKADSALNIALIAVPVAILCARAYYVIFSWSYYAAHPAEILNIRQGGLAIYGGVIGGVLAGYFYCRASRTSFPAALDLVAPSIALGQAVGRWGNFLNEEAFGRAVSNPKLRFFPIAVKIGESWHWATFFYESAWCALIVIFLLAMERRNFFRRRGDVFGWYLFLYALERALVEGLRTDSLYLGPLRVSQLLSLAALMILALMLGRRAGGRAAILPALAVLLLGAAIAADSIPLTVALALCLPVPVSILYTRTTRGENE